MSQNPDTDFRPPIPSEELARSTLVVTGITVFSRLLGFARDLIIAYTLGGSAAADVFLAVFRIPNFVRRLTAEGGISMPFIPEYCRLRNRGIAEGGAEEGERRAMLFCRSAMLWVIVIAAPLCLLGMLYPEKALDLTAPGFERRPFEAEAAAELLHYLLPYTLILCTLAIGGAIMQSRSLFLSPVISPCIPNITVLLALGIAFWLGDIHLTPQNEGEPARTALIFCQALLFSGLLQWIYVGNNMRMEKLRWPGPVSFKPALRFVRRVPLSLCSSATHQANILIAGIGASFLADGAIAQLHYADQLITLPMGMFGMAIGIIALPKLSELAGKESQADLHDGIVDNMNLALYLSLPATAGLAGIAEPLVKILFMRGAFDAEAAHGTALALQGAVFCLPALAVARPLLAACHVKNYLGAAALAGLLSMASTAGLSLALPGCFKSVPLLGIGLSVSLGAWIFAVSLWLSMRRKKITPRLKDLKSAALPLLLSLLILFAALFCCSMLEQSPWLAVGLCVPACMIFYFWVTHMAGTYDAESIFLAFKKHK
ncbi:MAG: murein biosynthesis integral membrane protein MurJ [Desulfovibrionaceae bacterium]|nr:murein biosynthesis integral membrane protein MurJ [Desulfovibrionaceae bacterium]